MGRRARRTLQEPDSKPDRAGRRDGHVKKTLLSIRRVENFRIPYFGRLSKWPKDGDCKSSRSRVRWFDSNTYHHFPDKGKSARDRRLTAKSSAPGALRGRVRRPSGPPHSLQGRILISDRRRRPKDLAILSLNPVVGFRCYAHVSARKYSGGDCRSGL